MDLELQLDPDAVTGLIGLKALVAVREGRPRNHAVKVVWHDQPDRGLLEQGLTIAERRNLWRLERITPGAGTWLPGQPPPVLTDAETLDALLAQAEMDHTPLAPVAAFEGRRSISLHNLPEGPVTVSLERGVLRAVTAERAVAYVTLSGEEGPVRAAALLIAGSVPVRLPTASLAAQGICLAIGLATPARHRGAPALPDAGMMAAEALAHILGHLTDVILHYAPVIDAADGKAPDEEDADAVCTEAVHQMRVAVRRALSALSVFRTALSAGALDSVRAGLKALGKSLGHTRDWDVFVSETAPMVAQALPPDDKIDRLLTAALRRRRDYRKQLADHLGSPGFRQLAIELACFAAARFWHPAADAEPQEGANDVPAEPISVRDFAPDVLRQRWKKLLSAGKQIEELDIPSMHALRLRAKRARYAAEMFASAHPGRAAHRFIHRLSVLQQRLGVLNDGAVAAQLLSELGGASGRHGYAVGVVMGFTASRAERIRPRIIRAFEKFRRQPTYWG